VTTAAPARTSWREEARQDRLVRAQIDREREQARTRARIAERGAAAERRRETAAARRETRAAARAERDARRAAVAAWAAEHVTDLLFVPVIGVPALLAWTAMAAYGRSVYGTPGLALPAFSEGAMWAFAASVTIARRRTAADGIDRPVWHLRAGTIVFAAFGAALNFAHGMTTSPLVPWMPHGPVVGAVMALISVAGVTAHQLVTAGPRRSRAERDQARIDRERRKRELAARLEAVRGAVAELDADGNARLTYRPAPAPRTDGGAPAPADAPGRTAPERTSAPRTRKSAPASRTPTSAPRPGAVTDESAEVHYAAELADRQVPSKRRIKAELHVGQERAAQIHAHLTAVAAADGQHEADTERNAS
jgi:hypothetical protein